MTRLYYALFISLVISLLGSSALAQTAAERTTARNLAREGQRSLIDGDFATSADRFSRASALVDAPTLHLGLARAYVGLGRLVEAYELYQRITRAGAAANAPPAFQRAVEAARSELLALEGRLAWVTITATGLKDGDVATVTLNGAPVSDASLGVRRPVNAGVITVQARAEGYEDAELSFEVAEGEQDAEVVLELARLPQATAVAAVPKSVTAGSVTDDTPSSTGTESDVPWRTISYATLGVGAASAIAGVVLYSLAGSSRDELGPGCSKVGGPFFNEDWECQPRPTEKENQLLTEKMETGNLQNSLGFIGVTAGAVLLAAGASVFVLAPEDTPPGESSIQALVSPSSFHLRTTF